MNYGLHDLAGNIGVALILGAYLLVQLGRLDARSVAGTMTNAIGAGLIVLSLSVDFNLSAFVVESAWCAISLFGAARALRARRLTP
jgi:paired small multidrug resistance pump